MDVFTEWTILAARTLVMLLFGLDHGSTGDAKLTVVSEQRHIIHLYEHLKNEEPALESDPALTNALVRKRICRNITSSEFFRWEYLKPILQTRKLYRKLKQRPYASIFRQTFARTNSEDRIQRLLHPYEYTNPYRELHIHVVDSYIAVAIRRILSIVEHVFACFLKDRFSKNVVPLYVSKEYDLFGEPGRFLFRKLGVGALPNHYRILLAEEPAIAYTRSDYNVELDYLARKRYTQPATSRDDDPVCKLVSTNVSINQSYRLCVKILGSAYFQGRLEYPKPWFYYQYDCSMREVSFKTEEASIEAAGRSYFEYMTPCQTRRGSKKEIVFYISRAYVRHEVFLYILHKSRDGHPRIYLENRSSNVVFVDEPMRFDDVE